MVIGHEPIVIVMPAVHLLAKLATRLSKSKFLVIYYYVIRPVHQLLVVAYYQQFIWLGQQVHEKF